MWKVRAIFGAFFLLSAISSCFADVAPPDQQLLTAAGDLVDIRSTSAKSFQLDADFTAQVNVPQDGHLTWKWVAKDLWSQENQDGGLPSAERAEGRQSLHQP
jgi:hypothetical protein